MLKCYVLATMLLITSAGFSKNQHHRHFQLEGFAVKTDALLLMNSAINKGSNSYNISGEIYFNNEYSFNVDLGAETENQPGWSCTEKRFGSHFRWYFKQDDCNCSAFFAGSYLCIVKIRQSVDQKLPNNNVESYSLSFLEGGLVGGFQALLSMHFVIDPSVQIGMEFPHNIHNIESINSHNDKDNGLLVRISLGIGYRF